MTDHIISPDGKFMWTGSEWIPAAPTGDSSSSQELKVSDTVIMGDLIQTTKIEISGIEDIVAALHQMGISSRSPSPKLNEEDTGKLEYLVSEISQYGDDFTNVNSEEQLTLALAAASTAEYTTASNILIPLINGSTLGADAIELCMAKAALGEIRFNQGDIETAENLLNTAYQESLNLSEPEFTCITLLGLIRLLIGKGNFEEGLSLGHQGLNIALQHGFAEAQAAMLNTLGSIEHIRGNYEVAQNFCLQALNLMENNDDVFLDSVVFRNLGLIAYQWKNDVEQATQYLSKALGNYISENNQLGILDVQNSLGGIYQNEGDTTNAEEQINKCIELGKKLGVVEVIATCTMNLGVIQMQTGRLESAEKSLYDAMKLFEEMNHFQVTLAHVNLAQLEKERNNLLMAKMHFSNALTESEERDAKDLQPDILTELAIIAEMENKPEEQRQFNQRAVSIWREIGVPIDQWFIDNGY